MLIGMTASHSRASTLVTGVTGAGTGTGLPSLETAAVTHIQKEAALISHFIELGLLFALLTPLPYTL